MIRPRLIILALLSVLLLSATGAYAQVSAPQGTPLGSGFTYQGQLKKGGQLFNGTCDFQFGLYDVATGGNQAGSLMTQTGVKVIDGVFAAKLDFGASVFTGEARWLQVAVKCPGDEGLVIFNTRQELTPTPYALGLRLPLEQITNSNTAFLIRNTGGRAIVGSTTAFATAVEGNGTTGDGVVGTSNSGRGVTGISITNNGLFGQSSARAGVWGESTNWEGVHGHTQSGAGAVAGFNDGSGPGVFGSSKTADGIHGEAQGSGAGVFGYSRNGNGIHGKSDTGYAGFFEGKVRVKTLEIAGGADLAEPFDVTSTNNANIIPGTVVCIDPAYPGKLVVCASAYDRTVAGVISGAGGVQPGMVMRQNGSAADGQHPVALTGRVYVWADATQQPIQPGDLLTTSATPGHAAKAADHDKAHGAIIGKAMGALEGGKGLVLVLVALN
jgi:hypothetical protein